ncbi:hypothetical protein DPMN_017793 [Dreissena polymorpha]|uniref:Uncharacterized protein n=1 Tax=Dreissena polymorpha TaxID=45954 RepID=A0A9D4NHJ8_DREPO|nr:hypothetical protein DPMN_017793 [Dreissena polymorpha]
MCLLKCRVDNIESTLYYNCAAQNVTHERVLLLENKTLELEARQRESFILIAGIDEHENENCRNTFHEFLRRSLDIDRGEISVLRANRVGRQISTNNARPRLIRVMMCHPGEVDDLMNSARRLAGTNFSLLRDYPKEISDARKQLWTKFKDARSKHGPRNVQMLFSAALRVNRRIVEDLFPEWYPILKGSRVLNTNERIHNSVASSVEMLRQTVHYTAQQLPRPAQKSPPTHTNKPPRKLADETSRQQPVDLTIKMPNPMATTRSRSTPNSPRGKGPSKPKTTQPSYLTLTDKDGNMSDEEATQCDLPYSPTVVKIMC